MTVLGISGVRDRCSAEGEVILLVKDNNGKQLRLSLGLGYSSSSVPKSLLSAARLMEDGAILHFEKGNSYIEFPNQGQRIPLIERGGLFYVPAVNFGITDGEMDSPKYAAQGSSKGASFLGFASEVDAKEACAAYAADAKGEKEANQAFAGGAFATPEGWHGRFGHMLQMMHLKKIASQNMVHGLAVKGKIHSTACACATCQLVNIRAKGSKDRKSAQKASKPGDVISMDIKYMSTTALAGMKYLVCFVDHSVLHGHPAHRSAKQDGSESASKIC